MCEGCPAISGASCAPDPFPPGERKIVAGLTSLDGAHKLPPSSESVKAAEPVCGGSRTGGFCIERSGRKYGRVFEGLSERLGGIFERLRKRGALSEADVNEALREVRIALLEADVALPVVKQFIAGVRERAVGQEVLRSVTPAQMVVKIVHDHLVEMLSGGTVDEQLRAGDGAGINLAGPSPVAVLLVGLQGSGKTTTTAKLAKRLTEQGRRKVLMASLDVRRPAAMEQLAVLGQQIGVETLPVVAGQQPAQIAQRALQAGRLGGYDVVLLDTAGRTTLDEAMMAEAADVKRVANPHEVLLVADSLTGQDAVNLARAFDEQVGLTGIVLTRVDGDGRGGAALSMRAVTGKPIKLMGTGERMDALEDFHPSRIADRILGMGDIVSLVEKAAATIDAERAARTAERMRKGQFDLNDLRDQLIGMQQMGGMSGLMGMLPGVAKMKNQLASANLDERVLKRQMAAIDSMTPRERKNPDLLKASRKKRIASGAGVKVEDINRILKMHRTVADVMKAMGGGKRGPMAGIANMLGLGGGMPTPTPEQMAELAKKMPGGGAGLPPSMPGLPPKFPGTGPLLPGLGGAKPGLGGFPGLGKKK
jgi:signal recognition particle subunit SRP54